MGIDVVHLLRPQARVVQSGAHRRGGAVGIGRGQVAGVGAHAETHQLGLDFSAPRYRSTKWFQHQNASALAQHQAGTVARKRAADVWADTRSASQPLMNPTTIDASPPPVMARSSIPARTMWNAWPMACEAEAQAEAVEKLGPRMPNSMETWLVPALGMILGTVSGGTPRAPSP